MVHVENQEHVNRLLLLYFITRLSIVVYQFVLHRINIYAERKKERLERDKLGEGRCLIPFMDFIRELNTG